MISCQTFRSTLQAGGRDAEVMEHLRKCDLCLEFSVAVDGDNFFRSIGGSELTPPGGVDAFVDGVMNQVHLRQAEGMVGRRHLPSPWRLAVAATILIGIFGAVFVYRNEQLSAPPAEIQAVARRGESVTKPIVESYDSRTATIVEVPGVKDAQVIMIFDDSLPADL